MLLHEPKRMWYPRSPKKRANENVVARLGTMQSADILCVHIYIYLYRERENHPFQKILVHLHSKVDITLTSVCRESFLFETDLFFICMFEGLLRLVLLGCV